MHSFAGLAARVSRAAAMSFLAAAMSAPAMAETGRVELPRFPSISPDGHELVFTWSGDLWRASVDGGRATRLTRHALDDLYSSWGPDGEWIVFSSMRDGYMNLWRIHRDGTRLTQLTHGDRFTRSPDYARDAAGRPVITFSGRLEGDVYREQRPYFVSPEGGEHRRLHDAFGSAPALSPDGRRLAFTRGGGYHGWSRRHYRGPDAMQVWVHARDSGRFEAITRRNGDDGNAQWMDGRNLVFMSDRDLDTVNLFRVDIDDPDRRFERLTSFEGRDVLHFDVSRDGSTAVVQVWDTLYRLDLSDPDAEPRPIALRAGGDGPDDYELRRVGQEVTEAALSPDGEVMAYIARGRVYVRHMDDHSATRAVTPGTHARHQDLAWSPDGLRLYFTSDADGTSSIYEARVALTRGEIRRAYDEGDARARLAISEGSPVAESGTDASPPDAGPQFGPDDPFAPLDPLDPPDPPDPSEPVAPGPTGEPEPAAEPELVPEDELEPEPADAPPRELDPDRWHDAVQFTVAPVLQSDHNDRDLAPSPDGRALAFRRGRGDLVVLDLRTGTQRTLVEGWDTSMHWRWSPDSRYIAYSVNDLNFSANIFIVPADGSSDPVDITRHPRNDLNPRWSADGRKLTFISNRSGGSYDLYRVYLDRELDTYGPRQLTAYYRDARSAAAKRQPPPVRPPDAPVEDREEAAADAARLDLEQAWRRVERVTTSPTHQFDNEMTPGGDRYVFNSNGEGLVTMKWDGSARKRIGSGADIQHLTLGGDRAVYVAGGRAGVVDLSDGTHERPGISDRIRIDLRRQALQKFREAARVVGESFYRPDMNGLDWPAVVSEYEDLIRRTRTASEFSDVANRLMGELGASHTGVFNPGPGRSRRRPSGRLGIEHERVDLEDGHGGYRVIHVVPNGPADRGPTPLRVGDVITRLDGEPFAADDTLLARLRGRVGEEVVVTARRRLSEPRTEFQALITPVDFQDFARLKYDAFREENRRKVEALSDDRLGYIHIQAMNEASLERFQASLYAAARGKEGLIVDVRNNAGGRTTDRILTSIMAPDHAYTIPGGADPTATGHYPQDRLDAPRYTLPINMVINEKSFSNAEILAHAFKTLDRGTLVGRQTYGGVITTGRHELIDGATVRLPFRGWYRRDGTEMELNGAKPDVRVQQTPEDEVAGRDRQLQRAVEDLLSRIDGSRPD